MKQPLDLSAAWVTDYDLELIESILVSKRVLENSLDLRLVWKGIHRSYLLETIKQQKAKMDLYLHRGALQTKPTAALNPDWCNKKRGIQSDGGI